MDVLTPPYVVPGYEPRAEGPRSEDERKEILQSIKQMRLMQAGMESPVAKSAISGVMGMGIGAFFSLMSTAWAVEDPFRSPQFAGLAGKEKVKEVFKDMGRGMWKSASGFGKVGALYAGSECVIEGYRAKNDIWNSVYAGFFSGGALGYRAGPRALLLGGVGFAVFSAAIDTYIRWDSKDEDA